MSHVITAEQFKRVCEQDADVALIDVRTPAEFRELHVAAARNVPLDRLDPAVVRAEWGAERDKPLYVVCRSGSRGKQACEKLSAAGLANVVNVEGGTLACEQIGLSMVRGQRTISLERQVRIEGAVERVSARASDSYFASRPLGSRHSAMASPQSAVVPDRAWLEREAQAVARRYPEDPPRPPHWGGYRVSPEAIEFWQGRSDRLHDRLAYHRQPGNTWLIERLAP